MQEQHQQQHHQQQSESVVNIKRVSLPFVSHGLLDTDMSKGDDVPHILKQKPQHVETLVTGSTQLVNLSSMDHNSDSVVNIPKELILISLVSQEQALYNPKHSLYRSTKSKDEKWAEIGRNMGWTGEWSGVESLSIVINTKIYICLWNILIGNRCTMQVEMEGHAGPILPRTETRQSKYQSQVEILQGTGLSASLCAGSQVSNLIYIFT